MRGPLFPKVFNGERMTLIFAYANIYMSTAYIRCLFEVKWSSCSLFQSRSILLNLFSYLRSSFESLEISRQSCSEWREKCDRLNGDRRAERAWLHWRVRTSWFACGCGASDRWTSDKLSLHTPSTLGGP